LTFTFDLKLNIQLFQCCSRSHTLDPAFPETACGAIEQYLSTSKSSLAKTKELRFIIDLYHRTPYLCLNQTT